MSEFKFVDKEEAISKLLVDGAKPVTMIGTEEIRQTMDETAYKQISNIANAPGVDEFVVNPDFHVGYGTVVGSAFSSREMIFPCAVGPDIACGMSMLQLNVPAGAIADKTLRREIIDALGDRIPLGAGNHVEKKTRKFDPDVMRDMVTCGATPGVLDSMGIPKEWALKCENATYGNASELGSRFLELSTDAPYILEKMKQIGGIGAGNHFQSIDVVRITPGMEQIADAFGLKDGYVSVLNHFGSRGFGFMLTEGGRGWPGHFRKLAGHFNSWRVPFPGGDKHNVYAPLGTAECDDYLNDMHLGANFATINHLLICTYVLEAFKEVLGNSVSAEMVYHISHNIIQYEVIDKTPTWVHRKGATRALWGGHHALKGTLFESTGHPVLLPGNAIEGSHVMVGQRGSKRSLNSVNHGAGRAFSRTKAKETFRQKDVDAHFEQMDILTNCRKYPIDECSGAYKKYSAVIDSVEKAGLASSVATLMPRIVIKDSDESRENSA